MDDDIRHLLETLNVLDEKEPQTALCPEEQKVPGSRWYSIALVGMTVLCCMLGVALYRTLPGRSRVQRLVEAPSVDTLFSPRGERVRYLSVASTNDLSQGRPETSMAPISACYDVSRYTSRRTQVLERMATHIHNLLKTAIACPDLSYHDLLRHLLVRFEEADVHQMNEALLAVQEKRDLLKGEQDRQNFDAALSCVGLGNIDAYQRRADEVAVAAALLDDAVATIKASENIVETAKVVKASLQLLNELKNDSLVVALVDVNAREKAIMDAARSSAEKWNIPSKRSVDYSRKEKESIAYLWAVIPSIDAQLVSSLYEDLSPKVLRATWSLENHLQHPEFFVASKTLFYTDRFFQPTEG